MRRFVPVAFTVFALVALSACASSTGGTAAPAATAPSAVPAASEPAASEPAASAPAAGGGGCSTSSDTAAVTVQIANFAFDPPEVTAKVGETIGWTNNDSTPHTATLDDSSCDTGRIAADGTAGLVFDAAGTYAYHCEIHPNMTATITITE